MNIESCPVVYPTWEEFNNFHSYTEYLEKTYSENYGMVKVTVILLRLYHRQDGRQAKVTIQLLTPLLSLEPLNRMLLEWVGSISVLIFQIKP